jgi:hypothetical protein
MKKVNIRSWSSQAVNFRGQLQQNRICQYQYERIRFNEDDFELDRLSLEPDSDEEEEEDTADSGKASSSPFVKLVPAKQRSKTVAIDQISGYSVQISATPKEPTQSKISSYESFSADGNLYLLKEKNLYKLRLGVFKTRAEAEVVLKKIAARKDNEKAFVVAERGAGPDLVSLERHRRSLPVQLLQQVIMCFRSLPIMMSVTSRRASTKI